LLYRNAENFYLAQLNKTVSIFYDKLSLVSQEKNNYSRNYMKTQE